MCQASVPLRVRYRLPWHRPRHQRQAQQPAAAAAAGVVGGGEAAPGGGDEGIPGLAALVQQLQDDFRARFEPRLDAVPPEVPLLLVLLLLAAAPASASKVVVGWGQCAICWLSALPMPVY